MSSKINPKYSTIIGAILVVIGFAYARITGKADVIIMMFTLFLGIFLFFIGLAGLIGNWLKEIKK